VLGFFLKVFHFLVVHVVHVFLWGVTNKTFALGLLEGDDKGDGDEECDGRGEETDESDYDEYDDFDDNIFEEGEEREGEVLDDNTGVDDEEEDDDALGDLSLEGSGAKFCGAGDNIHSFFSNIFDNFGGRVHYTIK